MNGNLSVCLGISYHYSFTLYCRKTAILSRNAVLSLHEHIQHSIMAGYDDVTLQVGGGGCGGGAGAGGAGAGGGGGGAGDTYKLVIKILNGAISHP